MRLQWFRSFVSTMMDLMTKRIVNHLKTIDYVNQCRTCSGLVPANHCLGLAQPVVEVFPEMPDQWMSTVVLDLVEAVLAGLVGYLVLADVSTEVTCSWSDVWSSGSGSTAAVWSRRTGDAGLLRAATISRGVFVFLCRTRRLANHLSTCLYVIPPRMASSSFCCLVGKTWELCAFDQAVMASLAACGKGLLNLVLMLLLVLLLLQRTLLLPLLLLMLLLSSSPSLLLLWLLLPLLLFLLLLQPSLFLLLSAVVATIVVADVVVVIFALIVVVVLAAAAAAAAAAACNVVAYQVVEQMKRRWMTLFAIPPNESPPCWTHLLACHLFMVSRDVRLISSSSLRPGRTADIVVLLLHWIRQWSPTCVVCGGLQEPLAFHLTLESGNLSTRHPDVVATIVDPLLLPWWCCEGGSESALVVGGLLHPLSLHLALIPRKLISDHSHHTWHPGAIILSDVSTGWVWQRLAPSVCSTTGPVEMRHNFYSRSNEPFRILIF